jgi:amino acid transporter
VTLDAIDSPLTVLSSMYGVSWLAIPLEACAMTSFFALALSCINAGSRVIFAMSRHGAFHECFQQVHDTHKTPHKALAVMGVIMFGIISIYCVAGSRAAVDAFGDAGTMGAFGFIGAYALICIAAPLYLKKTGELKTKDMAFSVAGMVLLLIPAVGSVYPAPPAPDNYFPYVFGIYLLMGLFRAFAFKIRDPKTLTQVREELKTFHLPAGLAIPK